MDMSLANGAPANSARRKRVLDDFEPQSLLYTGSDGDHALDSSEQQHRRSSLYGPSTDFFADVHSGFQTNNLLKSRRLTGELDYGVPVVAQDDAHATLLGSLQQREVLAPLTGSGSPGPPSLMSEPLQKANAPNPFLPASAVSSFSTSQLDGGFRLESPAVDQKDNKARLMKPVPKRGHQAGQHGTPRLNPPQLPALSQLLSTGNPSRSSSAASQGVFPSAFGKSSVFLTGTKSIPSWRAPSATSLAKSDVSSVPPGSGPSTPAITAIVEPAVRSEVGIAFGDDLDQCSSDEEFSMENEISLSQDKLNNLSVHDIPEHLLEGDERSAGGALVVMQLSQGFAGTLSEQEERGLNEIGAFTVPLKISPDPIVLGRDHFYPVFGDKIRGCETFHLSRRHCVFHVARADSKESSKQYKVIVENTSTNGLDVNGHQMKNGEQRELHIGDTVTLLKIRNHGVDISLSYTLTVKKGGSASDKRVTPSRRSPRFARGKSNGKVHSARKPRAVPNSNPFALPFSPPRKKMRFPNVRVDILIADPFIGVAESPRQQSRGYRDELSATMASLAPVERLAVGYECATQEALFAAVQDPNRILLYAGGGESKRILIEDNAGMPASVDIPSLTGAIGEDGSKTKMVIVFAKSVATAQVFVDSGIQHVIFVNSSDRTRSKSTSYLRALLASLLKGSTIGEGHALARRAALGEATASSTSSDCLCGILPGGRSHDVAVGEHPKKLDLNRVRTSLPTLNALLIPSLPPYFLPQEEVIGEVIGALRKRKAQVCCLGGGKGVGKSSTSVYVAKYATDRRWYKDGVHYVDVESAFSNGKDGVSSGALGWTDDILDSDDKRQRITRRVQNEIDEILQLLHPKATADEGSTTLVVLDGCDRLNTAQFRDFIVKTAQAYPTVQILITMRQVMNINAHAEVVEESTIQLRELSGSDAASVFLSMAKICLDQERMKIALPTHNQDTLAKHPALSRLNGNPLLISRLVLELRNSKLDELQ